jgi:hypothetical protein
MSTMASPAPDTPATGYYAGLIDAQMTVGFFAKNASKENIRVTLASNDARVAEELAAKFSPNRVTIIKRPDKKDLCTALFVGDNAKSVLEFAAEHCVLKKDLAAKAIEFMNSQATVDEVKDVPMNSEVDDVSLDWASGFFDVRGIVTTPMPATDETKKRRGSVKLVLPKSEKFVLPALQKVLHGKVKKSSPCRLVYESKDAIKTFVETVGDHVRAKKPDLDAVMA